MPTSWSRGSCAGGAGRGPQLTEPGLVDQLQVGQDEVVLAREVLVEGGLGDAGVRDDPVDTDPSRPVSVEQAKGGGEDALPGRRGALVGLAAGLRLGAPNGRLRGVRAYHRLSRAASSDLAPDATSTLPSCGRQTCL